MDDSLTETDIANCHEALAVLSAEQRLRGEVAAWMHAEAVKGNLRQNCQAPMWADYFTVANQRDRVMDTIIAAMPRLLADRAARTPRGTPCPGNWCCVEHGRCIHCPGCSGTPQGRLTAEERDTVELLREEIHSARRLRRDNPSELNDYAVDENVLAILDAHFPIDRLTSAQEGK